MENTTLISGSSNIELSRGITYFSNHFMSWLILFWLFGSFESLKTFGNLRLKSESNTSPCAQGFSIVLKTIALIPAFGFSVYFLFLIKQTVFDCIIPLKN